MIDNFNNWCDELVVCGQIVQDGDATILAEEAERRFNRYLTLVDAVAGDEGIDVAKMIVKSITVQNDYGAYQSAFRALDRFPIDIQAAAVIYELHRLIATLPDWAGELLSRISNSFEDYGDEFINSFNCQLADLEDVAKKPILSFIRMEEKDGWLIHRRGVLGI